MNKKVKISSEEFQEFVISKLNKIDSINAKLEKIEKNIDENTQILKALEHSSQVHKAEIDKISLDIAHIQGSVKSMTNTLKTVADDLSHIETVTYKNSLDISKLKAVK